MMRAFTFVACLGASLLTLAPFGAADADVKEEVLSPVTDGMQFFVSPSGNRLVTAVRKGSRQIIVDNGVEGSRFDELLVTGGMASGGGAPMYISPDGSNVLYAVRLGEEWVIIRNSEEIARGPATDRRALAGLTLTPDGSHYSYHTMTIEDATDERGRPTRLIRQLFHMEGLPTVEYAGNFNVAMSPKGNRYAAFFEDPKTRQPVMVVNGEAQERSASRIVFDHAGRFFATYQLDDGGESLTIDGREVYRTPHRITGIHPAPAGERWAVTCTNVQTADKYLVMDGEPVGGASSRYADPIPQFSADGERWAAIIKPAAGRALVMVDGKAHMDYQGVADLVFSPDGSRFHYRTVAQGESFFVVDEEESDAYTGTFTVCYANGGKNLAWYALPKGNQARHVFVDGKRFELDRRADGDTLDFAPDGSRWAIGTQFDLLINAEPLPGIRTYNAPYLEPDGTLAERRFRFSPDSAHIAFVGTADGARGRTVFLNDKPLAPHGNGVHSRVVFSPDSKHLYWLQTLPGNSQVLFVDGEPVVEYFKSPLDDAPGSWEIFSDGTLRVIGLAGTEIKRWTITPDPEKDVAALPAAE